MKKIKSSRRNRQPHGTPLELKADNFAQNMIDDTRDAFVAERSKSAIAHILAGSTDYLAHLEDFESDYFGALSHAFQAGFRAGRRSK